VAAISFSRKTRFGFIADVLVTQLSLVRMLRGMTKDFAFFDSADIDEARFEQDLESGAAVTTRCMYWIRRLEGHIFSGDHASALAAAAKAQPLLWTTRLYFEYAEFHFYAALAHAAACTEAPAETRSPHRDALSEYHRQLATWAKRGPENFEPQRALVAAEIARIEGRHFESERLFEQAIRAARDNVYVHHEALASERAGRFYLSAGLETNGMAHLRAARACYARWGADGKVKQLDQQFPHLVEPTRLTPTTTVAMRPLDLDLLSVTKASQTLSGAITLDKLSRTLLTLVLEQGGADRVALVLSRGGTLSIAAEATLDEKGP
jgi:hypothetical protein